MNLYDANGNLIKTGGIPSTVIIAANDSSNADKAMANYVCDGINDEVELQNAINAFGENSGVIQLCNGTYNIDAFTNHDGYYYGLYFAHYKHEIIIRGVNHNHKSVNLSFDTTDKAAVINVTQSAWDALPSDKESYVIGSNRRWEFPYKTIGLEDLTIAIPDNSKPVVGADGMYLADMHVDHCFFKTNGSYSDPSTMNPKCIAIRGCPAGNIGYNYYFHHIKIIGWGTGFHVAGEALQLVDVQVQRARNGFVIADAPFLNSYPRTVSIHPMTMIACGVSYCTDYGVYFGTNSYASITIIDLNSEVGTVDNWTNGPILKYMANGTITGTITYRVVSCSNWRPADVNLWGTDHSADPYFKTTNLHSRRTGTTAQRPADPCFASQYYDTTLGKMLTYNGSAWIDGTGTAV